MAFAKARFTVRPTESIGTSCRSGSIANWLCKQFAHLPKTMHAQPWTAPTLPRLYYADLNIIRYVLGHMHKWPAAQRAMLLHWAQDNLGDDYFTTHLLRTLQDHSNDDRHSDKGMLRYLHLLHDSQHIYNNWPQEGIGCYHCGQLFARSSHLSDPQALTSYAALHKLDSSATDLAAIYEQFYGQRDLTNHRSW